VITVLTKSADDTRELGAVMASLVVAGDVIFLSGGLGAGKTTFAQGFGRGLGDNFVTAGGVVHNCRPPGNRDPHPVEVASCRPYLESQIDLIRPRVIVTLGNFATRLLLDSTRGIKQLRGRAYPYEGSGGNVMVVPTFHPSFVLRSGGVGEAMAGLRADLVRAKQFLRAAAP